MIENNKNQDQQHEVHEDAPIKSDAAGQTSAWKKFLGKKWVFPATYMAAAAIILSLMWAYQGSDDKSLTEGELGIDTVDSVIDNGAAGEDAVAVNTTAETIAWPVENRTDVEVMTHFYDNAASTEQKQASIIENQDTFTASEGIALARPDSKSFNVVAALSGKVTRVDNLPVVGNIVEITHDNGLKTVYSSLEKVTVQKDQDVEQGDVIAQAGRNELQKDLGAHVQFEVYENGTPVNPEKLLTQAQAQESADANANVQAQPEQESSNKESSTNSEVSDESDESTNAESDQETDAKAESSEAE